MKIILILLLVFMSSACMKRQTVKEDIAEPVYPDTSTKYQLGSIYHAASSRNLFEDIRASRSGDTITVILQEQTAASKSASTNTKKSSGTSLSSPTIFGRTPTSNGDQFANNDFDSSTEFSGEGDSSQSNSLTGNVTVMVTEVLPNGNLRIRGRKSLTLNQGSEDVTLSGIIRPIDITPENTITSGQIANARITYGGKGMLADSNRAGWMTRFFNSGWWPF